MRSDTQPAPASKAMFWTGWILTVLPSLMLFFSASLKLGGSDEMLKSMDHLGYPGRLLFALGILEVACTLVYLNPRTAALGAILLTGYLGGAIATHVRLLEGQAAVPVVLGVLIWGGLFLRDARVRALIPVRR
ncbi:MAG TPA: DoxX family protein [Gemmataceae bacterium]|nr:DoxX family protein [Gemmataceae bacterium]